MARMIKTHKDNYWVLSHIIYHHENLRLIKMIFLRKYQYSPILTKFTDLAGWGHTAEDHVQVVAHWAGVGDTGSCGAVVTQGAPTTCGTVRRVG